MIAFDIDGARLLGAAATVASYAALCLAVLSKERRKAAAQAARGQAPTAGVDAKPLLIVHASQTGAAEQLAWQTARALRGPALPPRVAALGTLAPGDLATASRVLFIASTCGEGDAPDAALPFVRRMMDAASAQPLSGLRYGLLALGDREFANFCAFGRRLDGWLRRQGARPLFERIEVDAMARSSLARWTRELGRLSGAGDALAGSEPACETWRLARRTHVNPGSLGAPVFHLELEPPAGATPDWEPGDLLEIQPPHASAAPRPYSIASIPADGRVHLLVRQERRGDGELGLASGWLTAGASTGGEVAVKLRPHRNFRLGDNAWRPLILVGNGTGIAGLRAHLRARASRAGAGAGAGPAARPRHWLVFGERQAAHDFHYRDDIEAWQADGTLARLDLAFSRDQAPRRYVQDCLRAQPALLRQWLDDGAALYVCGSLRGMAAGVEEVLVAIVGDERVQALKAEGRYRRDVY
ncbi:MAG: flavodoxin domain-containing protein [Burkholderiales bacterium]|nr:flavodoxin domain-containing protein [Burkholderiales bacterium]